MDRVCTIEALAFSYAESDSRAMTGDLEISAGRPGDAATIPTATRQTTLGKRRVVVEPADVAARTVGTTPVSAEFERPPLSPVAQVHSLFGRCEDQRACLEHMWQSTWIVFRVRCNFGEGDVAGRVNELAELAIGDRCAVHPEFGHANTMDRRFLRIMPVRTHAIGAARHIQHPLICWMLERLSVVRRRFRISETHHDLRAAHQAACVASSITLPKSCFARYATSAGMF